MEKTSVLLNEMFSSATEYTVLQVKALRLEIYERVTNLISLWIRTSTLLVIGVFAIGFLNIGLGFFISDRTGSFTSGFLAVGLIYTLLFVIYLFVKDRLGVKKLGNIILRQVSKNMDDFDELIKKQEEMQQKIEQSEKNIGDKYKELKDNFDQMKEDISRLRSNFTGGNGSENGRVGPRYPRIAVTSAINWILGDLILRRAGMIRRFIIPLLTNTIVTSKLFKEKSKTSLVENLKLKFSKFLN